MDTRTKILSPQLALDRSATEALPVVQLDCDPLLAPVLAQLPSPCTVFVAERPDAYLDLPARAQLAASLAAVRYVALGEHPAALDLRPAENEARRRLEQLVLAKSQGA